MSVWENIRQGVGDEFIVRSFEITKLSKENDRNDIKNQFNETEILQLKAAIDKAINEQNVKKIQGTKTDTTKSNKE